MPMSFLILRSAIVSLSTIVALNRSNTGKKRKEYAAGIAGYLKYFY